MYDLILSKRAKKDLNRLEGELWERVMEAINALRQEPRPNGCKKLKVSGSYRVRVSNHRITYNVDDRARTVTILRVLDRKDVYR